MVNRNDYIIDLLAPQKVGDVREYEVNDELFAEIDGLIRRGEVHTTVECVSATGMLFNYRFHSVGVVVVPCDRCLADIELRIDTTDELAVRLGDEFSDEGDTVIIAREEGTIDLAQYIYEFIALSMPIQCVHEPGMCDAEMIAQIEKHQAARSSQQSNDERWNKLKTLINN